jgi:hypothetical protein
VTGVRTYRYNVFVCESVSVRCPEKGRDNKSVLIVSLCRSR